eukprot:CAMPEP_0119366026 /NCGR_PEP_ID=MMETSP1334-20130426/12907_1 /TAXON_ID=127549 /ORGANISM="Calcidiscus leptoporus, Strain RCC1130" /LENGTH=50 /DNA_ID=CAMNT_0007382135 /DNA_START=154 /DNA_END=302 /DNA_ORIENTATION=-
MTDQEHEERAARKARENKQGEVQAVNRMFGAAGSSSSTPAPAAAAAAAAA